MTTTVRAQAARGALTWGEDAAGEIRSVGRSVGPRKPTSTAAEEETRGKKNFKNDNSQTVRRRKRRRGGEKRIEKK